MEFINSISGLNAAYTNIKTIGDNIKNASTIGFKSHKVIFNDLFSNSIDNKKNSGIGVKISKIIQNFEDGKKINTQNPMDISINENGFFKLKDPKGHTFYSRNGHFIIDKNDNITNLQGMYLIGYKTNRYTNSIEFKKKPGSINFTNLKHLPFKPTTKITIKHILNTKAPLKFVEHFNPFNPNTYNVKSTTTIYDSFKKTQNVDLFFLKKDSYRWIMNIMNNNNIKDMKSYVLEFDNQGQIQPNSTTMAFAYFVNSKKKRSIPIDLKNILQKNINKTISMPIIQNGQLEGNIKNIFINKDGVILGKYSNGKILKLGQIALYDIKSKDDLKLESNNMWSIQNRLTLCKVGIPGDSYFKNLSIGCLEKSNVNLNKELTNIIIAQRNYQSNAQMIQTQDKMFHTLINLK